ncbi:hypothetical protein [Agromyces silvae]|uniref:hypothetical protein n=1 Tax=Agromyces silvae TaxID=3388266 RepID=UPI00280B0970|nr:hypothetical protein [Agromyces protaetiae]
MPAHMLTGSVLGSTVLASTLLASTLLASTLLSPLPASAAETNASDVTVIELVGESIGVWFTVKVNQACPDTHPYVHVDGWTGSLPEHVYFDYRYEGVSGGPATRIRGAVKNWNLGLRYAPLDLTCTSDPNRAIRIPQD